MPPPPIPHQLSNNLDPVTSAVSASSETYENSVQIVKNVIDADPIDKAVVQMVKGSGTPATAGIVTQLSWTAAREELRKFYVTNVCSQVGFVDR